MINILGRIRESNPKRICGNVLRDLAFPHPREPLRSLSTFFI
jgi:hypothetical protein